MKEEPEKEPLCREHNEDKPRQNLCGRNGYYLLGSALALASVFTFVGSLASLQMIQVRDKLLSQHNSGVLIYFHNFGCIVFI